MKQIIHSQLSAPALSATFYRSMFGMQPALNGSTLEGARGTPWSVAGDFSNLKITLGTAAPGTGNARIYTLMKNGAATALAVTITHPATSGSDTSNTVTVAPGDTVSLRITNTGGTPTASSVNTFSVEFDADSDSESGYCASPAFIFSDTSALYNGLCFGDIVAAPWTDTYRTNELIPIAGNLSRFDVAYNVAGLGAYAQMASGDSVEFVILKNGVVQDGTGGTTDTTTTLAYPATTASWTGTLACTAGSVLKLRITPNGSMVDALSYPLVYGWCFDSANNNRFWLGSNTLIGTTASPFYGNLAGGWGSDATEANVAGNGSVNTWYALDLQGVSSGGSADPTGFSSTFRVNSATPAGSPSDVFIVEVTAGNTDNFGVVVVGSAVSPGGSFATITSSDTWNLRHEEAIDLRGSIAFGVTTTVQATHAIAFGVDGNVNVHDTPGVVKIFGDLEVTGTMSIGTDVSDDLDGLGT